MKRLDQILHPDIKYSDLNFDPDPEAQMKPKKPK